MAAWDTQIRYYTRKSIEIEYVVDTMLEENVHDILCSALVDDCIERAKSIKQGGAKYDWVSGLQVGIANLGNSPAAVKKLVFDRASSVSNSWRRRWRMTSRANPRAAAPAPDQRRAEVRQRRRQRGPAADPRLRNLH